MVGAFRRTLGLHYGTGYIYRHVEEHHFMGGYARGLTWLLERVTACR